jgi:hypothetical protein
MSRITELGISSSLSKREARELEALARNRYVIEIGSLLGYSTILMAKQAISVVAIDPHAGYPSYNPSPTLNYFMDNITKHGVSRRVIPVLAKAQDALPVLRHADMAFIDATGRYDDTRFCLDNLYPEVLACHDYGRRSCEGATRAVDEFVKRYNKQCRVVDTLAIIT